MTPVPAEIFAPGEYIAEELEAREWTQEDLARIIGKPLPSINKLIKGKTSVTASTAHKLAAAFETSADLWMNLESAWQLHNTKDEGIEVRERAAIYNLAPVREMIRRGWIAKTETREELEDELRRHFCVDDLGKPPERRMAARSSTRGECGQPTPAQWAWMCRCRNISDLVDARKYGKGKLKACISELRALAVDPEEIRNVPRLLEQAGVRLVAVKHLKGTTLDGGVMHRNEHEPVVGLSLRFGRLDNFWFTLMHELAHVLHDHGVSADSDLFSKGEEVDSMETQANELAAGWLVDQDELGSFIRRTSGAYSSRKIQNFANRLGIHPSIVVGQLQFRREVKWGRFSELNVDVRESVRQSVVSDGWGDPAPT